MPDDARRIAAVILAAGASSRLGETKQLVEYRGETLLRRAARAALEARVDIVVVVLGAHAEIVGDAVRGMAGIHTTINERWEDGLATSLVAGVREAVRLDPSCDAVLIMTADQPLVDHLALRALLDAFSNGARLVAAEYSEAIGVPAVIAREHFSSLGQLDGDAGAGRWLRERVTEVTRVPLPDAALDIDDASDLKRLASLG